MRSRQCLVVLGVAGALGLAAASPAVAGLFTLPTPELIYSGAAAGLPEGVLVIRDADAFAQAVAPLDPAFGGPPPDLKKRTILRVVGRPLDNRCRDTVLIEVSTRNLRATVTLEERVPEHGCECGGGPRPPKAFLIAVGRIVRQAEVVKTDRVVACPEAERRKAEAALQPELVFEGSWDRSPGAQLIADQPEYREALDALGLADRGPAVDFNRERLIAVTGRARANGCRRTKVVRAELTTPEEAVFEIEESYAAVGQQCAQVFLQPLLFLYKVPATVMTARLITRELR